MISYYNSLSSPNTTSDCHYSSVQLQMQLCHQRKEMRVSVVACQFLMLVPSAMYVDGKFLAYSVFYESTSLGSNLIAFPLDNGN